MLKMRLPRYAPIYPVFGLLGACAHAINIVTMCNSSIYCGGDLLRTVQLARIFPDSKTFVDLNLVHPPNVTTDDFERLMNRTQRNPSREQLTTFVNEHFVGENNLNSWHPPDFNSEPPVLDQITDPKLKQFAKDVIAIWPTLGRKVVPNVEINPEYYSLLYVPNGFIAPGGRFSELYYWDSYWIVRGLLVSDMKDTARGMIENLLYLVNKLGYVPNGSRSYYIGRSQPPLLTAMVYSYFSATGDIEWLAKNMPTVETELNYWLENHKTIVERNGRRYMVLRYIVNQDSRGPRPESYYEDYESARSLPDDESRERFYLEMKSAATSGWDFSSRWFVNARNNSIGNLTNVHATYIVPVDLNSIYAGALEMAGDLRSYLQDRRGAAKWWSLAKYMRTAIEELLWDDKDGVWYDYDVLADSSIRLFYASCASPLWAGAVEPRDAPKHAERLVKYLKSTGALNYPGGIPTSLVHSGEQWDFPNAWPPLQSIVIGGLANSGNGEAIALSKELAKLWIYVNYVGYNNTSLMYEKYNVERPGEEGGGGEYIVQEGFGWTNGFLLELLARYGKTLNLDKDYIEDLPTVRLVK